jgi:hypothetical protein
MDTETAVAIKELQTLLENTKEDIADLKKDIKGLKDCYPSKESLTNLELRVKNIEANLSKMIWIVLGAIVSAVMALVLRG